MIRKLADTFVDFLGEFATLILSFDLLSSLRDGQGAGPARTAWNGLLHVTQKELASQLGITAATFEWLASAYAVKVAKHLHADHSSRGHLASGRSDTGQSISPCRHCPC